MIAALFSWWYTTGWLALAKRTTQRAQSALGFFSVSLLLSTLFDPFRQIAAGQTGGPLAVQFRAWGDRLFSRFVGFFVRTLFIFFGLVVALGIAVIGLVLLLAWPLIPLLPLLGWVMMVMGVSV